MSKKAVIAMSGGVDSSVAAAFMLKQGFQCTGVTLRLCGAQAENAGACLRDMNDAKAVASMLGINHFALDFIEEFENRVIRSFIESYEQGETPNPCIYCNRHIKFNPLLLHSDQYDFDYLATGHYARIEHDAASGRYLLKKAIDEKKDQSYVLYCLGQNQLEHACFPLGDLTKQQVRKIAEEYGFINAAKGESQDICFVPDGDYGSFIERHTGKTYPAGNILDLESRVLGKHKGIVRYTIGQRRGLGIAANIPVYVAAKSAANNTVTLGPESSLYGKSLAAKDINLIACADIRKPMRVMVKTRYLQAAQSALAEQTGEDSLHIEFDAPQRAITSGQAAVMYSGNIVVGGGTIV